MPTEIFTKDEFARALPLLARPLGLIDGEYCWVLPVQRKSKSTADPTGDCHVEIMIRSSVKANGQCAGTGQDSIRCTLVDAVTRKPLASKAAKPQRWVARTKNWRDNLLNVLRSMYKLGLHLGTCPNCKTNQLLLRRVTDTTKPSFGKLFVTCPCNNYFKFIEGE